MAKKNPSSNSRATKSIRHIFNASNYFSCRFEYTDYAILHTHDYWEYMLVVEGEFRHNVNGSTEILKQGDLRLIRPNDLHMVKKHTEQVKHINFIISNDLMKKQLEILGDGIFEDTIARQMPISFTLSERTTQLYVTHALNIQSTPPEHKHYRLLNSQFFNFFLQDLIKHLLSSDKTAGGSLPTAVISVMDAIKNPDNLQKTLSEIVQVSGYSYVHLSRLFKENLKMTLIDYFTASRMNTARLFLENTDKTILEISMLVGYGSLSHFNKVFKNHFKLTPSQYRRQWKDLYNNFEET